MALLKQYPPKIDVAKLFTENAGLFTRMNDPDVVAAIQHANHLYLYWDQFRYRPMPEGITPEQLWGYLHFQRSLNQRPVVLKDTQGRPFTYWLPDRVLQILNKIDRWSGETIGTDQPGGLPPRERYVISSLMEEAIASSQLEGAATTRQVAKQMLRSGRRPRNHHEQMIYNNWITVQHLRANRAMRLTPELLCEIHAMITEETMKDPKDSGRIRTRDDIVVDYCGETVHHPPNSMLLPQRVEDLCNFANNDEQGGWIHPVIKATILHFWIGYDHPFVDGNGRTARAIFYWYLLSRGYWLFEYLSISRYFLRAPSQYARAYLYTETDNRDLTYFLVYNLRVVQLAFQDLHEYLNRKQRELTDANDLLRKYRDLNDRQRNVIAHALRHPDAEYTVQAHKNVNNIVYETARTDLLDLVDRGLLNKEVRGRTYVFTVSDKIIAHLHH